MTKKSLSKLLSVILAIAICATTVLGCLITANAADVACYSWSEGSADSETFKTATIELTLTAPDALSEGFTTAVFEFEGGDWLLSAITVKDGVRFDGDTFSADDYSAVIYDGTQNVTLETMPADSDVNAEDIALSSVTLELALTFANDGAAEQGVYYSVTISGLQMGTSYDAFSYTASAVTGTVSAGCEHSEIAVKGNPVNTDDVNGYTVYTDYYCAVCGADKAELDEAGVTCGYQLVPTAESITGGTTITWSEQGAYDDDLASPEFEGTTQTGDKDNPIIIDTVEELYSLAMRTKWEDTLNKYYKLADGIDNVVLQSDEAAYDIMKLSSSEKVKEHFSSGSWYSWGISNLSTNCAFAGHFDGNGATVYGLYANNAQAAGLFPFVYYTDKATYEAKTMIYSGNVSISNINVTNSYMYGATRMGFIAGSTFSVDNANCVTAAGITGYNGDWYLNVDKCSVYNSYIYSTTSGNNSVIMNGVMVGYIGNFYKYISGVYDGAKCALIENSMVYGNTNLTVDGYTISLTGNYGRGSYLTAEAKEIQVLYDSLLVLGTSPYLSTANGNNGPSSHSSHQNRFSNVYTDASTTVDYSGDNANYDITYPASAISSVTADAVLGFGAVSACPNLEWGSIWSYGTDGNYPSLVSGTASVIGWDGSTDTTFADNGETGADWDNAIIIDSAAELYSLGRAGADATDGKYFKIADGIDKIVLQDYKYAGDIIALESAAQVKEYFSGATNIAAPHQWYQTGWNSNPFKGYFDGNGVEVYGLYSSYASTAITGLFPLADDGAVIENVALKNSYLSHTTGDNFNFGGLVGAGYSADVSETNPNGIITIRNCAVINNYMYKASNSDPHTRAGILVGPANNDVWFIVDCLAYGNDATYTDTTTDTTYDMSLRCLGTNNLTATTEFYETYPQYTHDNATYGNCYRNMMINVVSLDCLPYNPYVNGSGQRTGNFVNVYTNVPLKDVSSGTTVKITADELAANGKVTYLKTESFEGFDAVNNLDLGWGEEWLANVNGYPSLAAIDEPQASTHTDSSVSFVGANTAYNNDGSLDLNFHFISVGGYSPVLYVGKADANTGVTDFIKVSEATASSKADALAAVYGENDYMMFTIPNLSARDIHTVWVPTLVVSNTTVTEYSVSRKLALADYAEGVLNGEAVYTDDAERAQYEHLDKKVAAALINYGVTANKALSTTTLPSDELNVVYVQYGTASNIEPDGSFMDGTHGTGTETDPYVISTPGQLRYLAQQSTYETTHGKFFEIDENIDILCLQAQLYIGDIDEFMSKSADEVMTFLSNTTNRTQWQSGHTNNNDCFSGTLDGNGVTIVGMYTANGGLFNVANEGAAFKNITVSNSYINAGWYAGAILGSAYASETYIATIPNNTNCYGVVSFENIVVNDNYILNKGNAQQYTGALVGAVTTTYRDLLDTTTDSAGVAGTDGENEGYAHIAVYASNILTYDNSIWAETVKDSGDIVSNQTLFGNLATGHNGMDYGYPNGSYDNVVTIDCVPFAFAASNQAFRAPYYKNVYSGLAQPEYVPSIWYTWNQYDITFVDAANLKGAAAKTNMPGLDWANTWAITEGYPTLADVDYVASATAGKTIYWDGSYSSENSIANVNDTGAAGTSWDTAIIIDNAAELNYVLRQAGVSNTTGKYFKVADGIDKIVLQPEGVLDLDVLLNCTDGEAVKAYFDTLDASKLVSWSGGGVFNGNIDGNGAQIIGLYDVSSNLAGLVGAFDGGATGVSGTPNVDNVGNTIKGFTVGYSYLKSASRLGMFGAQAHGDKHSAYVDGTWNVDTCAVVNCYMEQTYYAHNSGHSGIITGDCASDVMKLNNILIYGNKAFSSIDSTDIWIRRNTRTGQCIYVDGEATEEINYPTISNSIVLGASPYRTDWKDEATHGPDLYSNVYTDAPTGTVTLANGTTVTYSEDQIQSVTDLSGANAQSVVDALNAANVTTVWYVGALDDMPGFKQAGNVPALYQSEIDSVTFTTPDTVGAGTEYNSAGNMIFGVYKTALSLKANPYISFAFAFGNNSKYGGNDYKTNRGNIKIRFTYKQDGETVTGEEISVPAYTGEDIRNADGWTNTTANGRFHTFRAEGIPVEALAYGIKVEASYNGGEWQDFGTYSVEGLGMQFDSLSKTQPGDYYSTRVDATKALMFYAQAIAARYGA